MIPVNTPLFGGNEKKYLLECIESGWISSEGPFVSRFEDALAAKVQRQHGIAVANGSVALDVAVAALRIGPGDEVIMPTFTIISPAASVVRAGAIPVLVDSDPVTWNMDVTQIESKITSRTKAILVVHIYGLPVDMDPVLALAEKYHLAIIEDAAEMHGQTYRGRPCGGFGDISTFSFYANKHITTGEGGMILTNDLQLADRCRSLRNLCFLPHKRFVHEELGWNFRLTNLQAAVGLAQLESLDKTVLLKRKIGSQYRSLLQWCADASFQPASMPYADNVCWVFGLVSEKGVDASTVMKALAEVGIGTRPFFWPMHEQPVFNRQGLFVGSSYPTAEKLARFGWYLPSGCGTTLDQVRESSKATIQILSRLTTSNCNE
ncbi:MAG: DegT/DnrJ/EryC1/StrS family aminotransferase [Planctomycetales bacterium]|nr:DegT/DnrJ/EryC1/StrS family aminotransferase [Planctomycetales bacterium]